MWTPRQHRSIPWSTLAIGAGFIALGVFVFLQFWDATRVNVRITGIEDGAYLSLEAASNLQVHIDIAQLDLEAGITPTLFFNGVEPDEDTYEITDDGVYWTPGPLDEGTYQLAMSIGRPLLSDARFTWNFVVDNTPPAFEVISPTPAVDICESVTVHGRVEPGVVSFEIDGVPHDVEGDGTFELHFDLPPTEPILLSATDQAGNRGFAEIVVPVEYPSTQAMHVTAAAWGYTPLREHILAMVDAGQVNAVQLDLKDEAGIVGYDTDVELARQIGAARPEYVLEDALEVLHGKGVRVIGRIVAFRDGPLARWATENGRHNYVILGLDGEPLPNYGGFTNVANPDVRQYNIDIALEAADRGVDEILWDYVRRPEGDLDTMIFPGLQVGEAGSEREAINNTVVSFLADAAKPLRERCVYQGASLFGVAARNPGSIGQPVPGIARVVDYIAPMLYPSHWVRGEYRVAHPNAQPYDIVEASLTHFLREAAGSGVAFNLWVQDFSIGIKYGPDEVRAQIMAARDLGVDSWLLWNPNVRYTTDAITPELVDR